MPLTAVRGAVATQLYKDAGSCRRDAPEGSLARMMLRSVPAVYDAGVPAHDGCFMRRMPALRELLWSRSTAPVGASMADRVAIATPVELPKNVGSRAVASELRLADRASCGTDAKPRSSRSGLCRVERRSERIEAAVEA